MTNYWRTEKDERSLSRCIACDSIVFSEISCAGRADADSVCLCGMTLADSAFSGGDYYAVVMRVGRPLSRGARLRRAG